jgi:myo-inositol-1(or 4)-monophosphatase
MKSRETTTEIYRFARELAVEAGELLRAGFSRAIKVTYKGRIDPVTEIDLKSEKFIVTQIKKRFPHHDIVTEEDTASRKQGAEYRWIIDPLDGTVNFSHGFPIYCVSIAVEQNGKVMAGAVCDPEREELFHAMTGQGAYLNNLRIRVSKEKNLERALLATGFAYDIGTSRQNNLGYFARMAKKAQGVRRPGSAAIDICWLAAGRLDGFWELKLHPWDTAAAELILREAGGKTTRMNGSAYSIYAPDMMASNGYLHRAMQKALGVSRRTKITR